MENNTKIIEKESSVKTIAKFFGLLAMAIIGVVVGMTVKGTAIDIVKMILYVCFGTSVICAVSPFTFLRHDRFGYSRLDYIILRILFLSLFGLLMIAFGQYIAFDQYIVSKIPIPTLIKELPEEEKEAVSVMGFYSLVLILITELFYFNSANMDDDMQKGIKIMVLIAVTSTLLFGCIYVGHFLL